MPAPATQGSLPLNLDQILLFAILATALVLFIWGRIRYDLVAILALLATVLLGIVPAEEAFLGFGHPAVITVAAILIMTRALRNSGLVDQMARLLAPLARHPIRHVMAISTLTAACSAFMNNVGAVALILPVALKTAIDAGRSPSGILMPLSFASLLGGLVTLIGTPPNIIIAAFRNQTTAGKPFGMFDFAPVGLAVAVAGLLFICLVGWRLLPRRAGISEDSPSLFQVEDYITEVRLLPESSLVGKRIIELETMAEGDVAVVAMIRRKDRILAPSGYLRLQEGDILVVEAGTVALKQLAEAAQLALLGATPLDAEALKSDRVAVIEAVVLPGARLEGRTARALRLHSRYGLNLLGVARQGKTTAERLGRVRFRAGDVLMLQGEREALPEALAALGCLPLAERGLEIGRRSDGKVALIVFGLAILAVVTGLLAPQIAFVAAAAALVLTREIGLKELYESVDWSIIVLLAALIPVGLALQTTGGSATIAAPLLAFGGEAPVFLVIGLLMLTTMLLSDVMNNAATAVLMAPIGLTVAAGLEANADPFLMAVAVGASSTYLTPIGHQSNLLVMGPGGYRFGDYWRLGLPLDVIILLVAVPMILLVWPA